MPNIINDIKLDFKDVLFLPKRGKAESRSDVSAFIFFYIWQVNFYIDFVEYIACVLILYLNMPPPPQKFNSFLALIFAVYTIFHIFYLSSCIQFPLFHI